MLKSRTRKVLLGAVSCLALTLVLLVGIALAKGIAPRTNPIPMSEESVEAGREVFFTYCSGCHGRRADGRGLQALNLIPKPQNLRNAEFVAYLSDERMYSSISGGVRGTSMPAFEMLISEEQRWHSVNYVRSLTEGEATGLPNSIDLQEVPETTENPVPRTDESVARGRHLYLNYCASCHGAKADGRGVIAPNLIPAPRNLVVVTSFGEKPFMDYLSDARTYDSITNGVPGTSMLPWIAVFDDDERWDIVHYLRAEADRQREKGEVFIERPVAE